LLKVPEPLFIDAVMPRSVEIPVATLQKIDEELFHVEVSQGVPPVLTLEVLSLFTKFRPASVIEPE